MGRPPVGRRPADRGQTPGKRPTAAPGDAPTGTEKAWAAAPASCQPALAKSEQPNSRPRKGTSAAWSAPDRPGGDQVRESVHAPGRAPEAPDLPRSGSEAAAPRQPGEPTAPGRMQLHRAWFLL